jgi:hypothetical protein
VVDSAQAIRVTEVAVWRGRKLWFRFSNGVIGGGDVTAFLDADDPGSVALRDTSALAYLRVVNGVPTWPDGNALSPDRLYATIEAAVRRTVVIEESNEDALVIAKSGAPAPSDGVEAWLADECAGRWRYRCKNVFDLHFDFEFDSDAGRFTRRWNGVEGEP